MTEEEAKTKYCPLKPLNKEVSNTCIASKCMWWVWGNDEQKYINMQLVDVKSGHCGAIK